MPREPLPFEIDPVIEAYKKDVDRTLIRENLRRTLGQRLQNLQMLHDWIEAGRQAHARRVQSNLPTHASSRSGKP
jgi:hypothetical protein